MMERRRTRIGTVAMLAALVAAEGGASAQTPPTRPMPVVFDTDICGDCDDVLALAMIHALESRGVCRLIAVTVSVDNDLAAPFVDAVNTFYGRGQVPIGVVRPGGVALPSRYLALAEEREPDGRFRFPHHLTSGRQAPDARAVLRAALASQPDGSVVLVQVGFATNLARLLDTPADAISPLAGIELVRNKVRLLSLMAGAFAPIEGNPRYAEYNIIKDLPSSQTLAARWPTPMLWSGFEIGTALPYPSVSIARDYGYVPHHPVAEAYIRYKPPPHDRPTWDLTSVLAALTPDRGDFDLSPTGTVTVEPDGHTSFRPGTEGRHRYLIFNPEQKLRVLEVIVQLASQPPSVVRPVH
jgi:inosine-uridine nucleoside N-ribohydrolase